MTVVLLWNFIRASAALPVKFQSDQATLNPCVAASRFRKISWYDVLPLGQWRLWVYEWIFYLYPRQSISQIKNAWTGIRLTGCQTERQTDRQKHRQIHTHKGDNVAACRRLDWVIRAYWDNTSQLWSLVLHIEENRSMKLHTTRPCFFPSDFLSNNGSGLPSDLNFQLRMIWWSGGWVGVFRALQLIDFQAFGVGD